MPDMDKEWEKKNESITVWCSRSQKLLWRRAFSERELSHTVRRLLDEEALRVLALRAAARCGR